MNKYCLLMLFFFVAAVTKAQERKISGMLTDRDTHEAVTQTTVQLLKSDSTFVVGAISNEKGEFTLTAPDDGNYLLKISSVGYLTHFQKLRISDGKDLALGKIVMNADAIMLKGTTVTGQAVKVTVREDTFVYNSAAFRTPEGSTIEELVKRLPGAQVSDDGKITINGKEVKKILVDGKEFMTGDTKTALKNLPTSIVDKIKSYDQRSDLARVSGIDDGDEQTVLDFGIKKGMNKFSPMPISPLAPSRVMPTVLWARISRTNIGQCSLLMPTIPMIWVSLVVEEGATLAVIAMDLTPPKCLVQTLITRKKIS